MTASRSVSGRVRGVPSAARSKRVLPTLRSAMSRQLEARSFSVHCPRGHPYVLGCVGQAVLAVEMDIKQGEQFALHLRGAKGAEAPEVVFA